MNPICREHGHDWSPTGLWVEGVLCVPCRRRYCEAERTLREYVRDQGFPGSVHGIPLDIDDDPQGGVAKIIMRELNENRRLNQLDLPPGSIVIDIGAHVGIVSIWLAKRYGATVHAYEPVWDNVLRMRANIKANAATGISVEPVAVTGDGRQVSLPVDLRSNSGGTSLYGGGWNAETTSEAPSVTLAGIFADHVPEGRRCNILKLDCEGAEYEILEAGEALLDRVDWLIGEFHVNSLLASQGKSIDGLAALCARHIPADHILVTPCRMGD